MEIKREAGETMETFGRRVRWLHSTVSTGSARPILTAWGDWLSCYPWEAWGTLTFAAGQFTHDAASRAWGRFARYLWAQGHGVGATWFVGHEVGAQGRLHLHCLLGMLGDLDRSQLWEWWFTRYGRAQIAGYDPERGAAHYVAKYVTKEMAHYDLDLTGYSRWDSLAALTETSPTKRITRPRGTRG